MKYRRFLNALAVVATVGLSLVACGGSPSPSATSPSVEGVVPATTSAPPATQEAKKSARGNIVKALGEPAGITDSVTKKQVANFAINAITQDAPCTGPYPQPAQNGHFVALDIVAETTPDLAESTYPKFDINSAMFQFVGANGTTYNGSLNTAPTYSCLPDSQTFPMGGMGPGEKVSAKVVLDVPETTGTLVFKSLGSLSGWEWTF
jgi:hypothetical protein